MRNRFDRQLLKLNNQLIEMGSLIEKAIALAIKALVNQDIKLAQEAIRFDEEINHQEREIETLCMKLLLQQQPVARDLRLISAALKMITDMERIGDHASDISEMTIDQKVCKALSVLRNGEKLSSREREILGLILENKKRKEIAEDLHLSENTIKTHTRTLYSKLGVGSREELYALLDN